MDVPIDRSPRTTSCDLCKGTSFDLISDTDRLSLPLRTVICRRCGLISHEQVPSDEELDEYYSLQYRQDYHGEILPKPHRVLRAWKGGQWLLNRLRRYVPDGSRVCEVGAGIGCTVKVFELAGYESEGIEPGQGFHQFAAESLRANIERRTLFDLPPEPTYDFLLLVHVIEHFNSPRRALTHIKQLLRPGGQVYVECPNIGAPHAAPGRQFHFAHIYNFTPQTLVLMAESCGLSTVARLSDERSGVLRYIFAPTRRVPVPRFESAYDNAIRSLQQQTAWKYHLRPGYLMQRVTRDVRFVSHRTLAGWRVQRLVQRCQRTSRKVTRVERRAA